MQRHGIRTDSDFNLGRLEGARDICERLRGKVDAAPLLQEWLAFLEDLGESDPDLKKRLK